jgi:allantoinase
MWTEASARGFGIGDLVRWLCAAPAALAGLDTGRIEPGRRADLVVWDPDAAFVVAPERLTQRHRLTPYRGRSLRGQVEATIVRGGQMPDLISETP